MPKPATLGFRPSGSSPAARGEKSIKARLANVWPVRKTRTGPKQLMGPALPGAHISIFAGFRQAAHEEAELLDWIKATKAKR
jgi:hypothetical protein